MQINAFHALIIIKGLRCKRW